MKNLGILNPENVSEAEAQAYPVREAARAIVLDSENKIALLHVSKRNYYKLPGGGIEVGEDRATALRRECQEEIGCDVEVVREIGMITEYRKMFTLTQVSHCYLARVKGAKGVPHLEEGEIEDGFKEVWLSYGDVERAMAESVATSPNEILYIVPRDRILIKEAREYLANLADKVLEPSPSSPASLI